MNLKIQLLLRIVAAGLLCWSLTAAYVLAQTHAAAAQQTQSTAESITKQLQFQLLKIDAGLGSLQAFPDFDLWKTYSSAPGVCASFWVTGKMVRTVCNGDGLLQTNPPQWFATAYQAVFQTGQAVHRTVEFNHRPYGMLNISPSSTLETAKAYADFCHLLGLSAVTVFAVLALVFFSIQQLLKPAQTIVLALQNMQQGDLAQRLPDFALYEWRRTAAAINDLAQRQQQLLQAHEHLAHTLLSVQEQERNTLARELHDEFGQCLAAIQALAASISQTAEHACPPLLEETAQITRITQHIMANLRDLLLRLRPADWHELGLSASLASLVGAWNRRSHGKTAYRLQIDGDCLTLPEPLPITLFRIIQECLTNTAKHAQARQVAILLRILPHQAMLQITDDGIANELPFAQSGLGLLGIRERVNALSGCLQMSIPDSGGLLIDIRIPLKKG